MEITVESFLWRLMLAIRDCLLNSQAREKRSGELDWRIESCVNRVFFLVPYFSFLARLNFHSIGDPILHIRYSSLFVLYIFQSLFQPTPTLSLSLSFSCLNGARGSLWQSHHSPSFDHLANAQGVFRYPLLQADPYFLHLRFVLQAL